jgi:hemolysin activation/secretion protein
LGATASNSATLSRPGGHTDFTKLSGQIRRTQSLSRDVSLAVTINGQYALDTLLTGEEISYGGSFIGRGYDPGSITGDVGVGAATEVQYTLDGSSLGLDQAQLFGFFDNGKVWNHTGASPHDQISSTGAGIRATALTDLTLGLEFAQVLIGVPGNAEGKHSGRVMFNTSVRF